MRKPTKPSANQSLLSAEAYIVTGVLLPCCTTQSCRWNWSEAVGILIVLWYPACYSKWSSCVFLSTRCVWQLLWQIIALLFASSNSGGNFPAQPSQMNSANLKLIYSYWSIVIDCPNKLNRHFYFYKLHVNLIYLLFWVCTDNPVQPCCL